jgi:hypothetical protein
MGSFHFVTTFVGADAGFAGAATAFTFLVGVFCATTLAGADAATTGAGDVVANANDDIERIAASTNFFMIFLWLKLIVVLLGTHKSHCIRLLNPA